MHQSQLKIWHVVSFSEGALTAKKKKKKKKELELKREVIGQKIGIEKESYRKESLNQNMHACISLIILAICHCLVFRHHWDILQGSIAHLVMLIEALLTPY